MTTIKQRRARGDGGLYQRKDGLWCGNLNLGWTTHPKTGKPMRRRKLVYGRTKTEAKRKLDAAKLELAQHGDMPTAGMTVEKWLTAWLDNVVAQQVKPKTLRTYRTYVEQYLIPTLGRVRLERLTVEHVESMHRSIRSQTKTVKGKRVPLSETTVRNAHRVLSGALRTAVRRGLVNRNVASSVYMDAPQRAASTRTGLTVDQARSVLKAAQDDRLSSRWMAAFMTGARQGELLGLRWEYVDLEAGILDLAWSLTRVPWQHDCKDETPDHKPVNCPDRRLGIAPGLERVELNGNLVLMRPKTRGSTRVVPIAAPLLRALEARRLDMETLERDGYQVDHGLVWCQKTGQPIDGRKDWQQFKDLLDKAGVPSVTLHEARNTAATLLRDAGVDDNTSAQILGHSDVITTRGYQAKDLGFARDAVAKLGDVLV